MSASIKLISKVTKGVVPLPRGLKLAEGTDVAITPLVPLADDPPFLKMALKLAKPRHHLPGDYALNRGHYRRGAPKK
ncbi:MAG: hypothetical protein PHD76_09885 [Methylacidiphilales bacterium]|nr:hypothetical protein [Candidatus Methylacidiphilales bacterium]